MAEKLANTAAQKPANQAVGDEDDDGEGPRPGARPNKAHDAFGAAFDAADKELKGKAAADKPKAKVSAEDDEPAEDEEKAPRKAPKAKAKPAAEEGDGESDETAADKKRPSPDKTAPKKAAKAAEADTDAEADDKGAEDDDSGETKPAAKKKPVDEAKDKPKGPLTAKPYWARERREAFPYQTREVQEAWLEEVPEPHAHWATEQKEVFAKQPRDVQEAWLNHTQDVERGYGRKFEALAAERKLAEGVRKAVTPEIRAQMEQHNLDEVGAFTGLLELQRQSVQDPINYVRRFIVRNKLDIRHFIPDENGEWPSGQDQAAPPQADITSHPVMQQMAAKLQALESKVQADEQKREEEQGREIDDDLGRILAERDEAGEPRYPYIRLVADRMAQIIDSDPEQYRSMSRAEQLAASYALALKAYPELPQPKRTAKKAADPAPVEEQDDEDEADDADFEEEDAATAKLKAAATKKSKTPLSAPGKSGDPFARAFSRAEKAIGSRH